MREKEGSPPPMRGKGTKCVKIDHNSRITPAYAGKSLAPSKEHHPLWDHPRLCGEKSVNGSPGIKSQRITPAYAGKSRQV